MNATVEIDKKISKIKNINVTQYGKEKLLALCLPASDYINALKKYNLLPNNPVVTQTSSGVEEVKKAFIHVAQMPFFSWINKQLGFQHAKERLIKAKLILAKVEDIEPLNLFSYMSHYGLEFIVANAICNFEASISSFSQAIFVPVEWKRLIEKNYEKLVLMSRNFELSAEEQLFLNLLNRLKNSKGSIFNSGKPHANQVREFFTKLFISGLFYNFINKEITNGLVTDVVLDILGDFFEPMKRSDVINLVNSIKENVKNELNFLQKTVIELLASPLS